MLSFLCFRNNANKPNKNYLNVSSSEIKRFKTSSAVDKSDDGIPVTCCDDKHMSNSKQYTYDYNSRENIANILKGSLLSGVVHVNPHTGMIRTPSPSNSTSGTKYKPQCIKSSSLS